MKIRLTNLQLFCALLVAVFFIGYTDAYGQESKADKDSVKSGKWEFCSNNNDWNGDKARFNELRESTVAAGGTLSVDGGKNGGISVRGENRNDILIRACVQTWGETKESAEALARSIKINTGSTVKAESSSEENWAVSYQILVPRSIDLNLTAKNGGINISSVEGNMDFRTINGGLHLSEISGNVKGRTTNGGIHIDLSGGTWRGGGLDLETTNGGVHLTVPANFAGHFETGTVNGGFHSDFDQLALPKPADGERRRPGGRVTADLNGGGALIRLITTNGGVHIGTSDDKYSKE